MSGNGVMRYSEGASRIPACHPSGEVRRIGYLMFAIWFARRCLAGSHCCESGATEVLGAGGQNHSMEQALTDRRVSAQKAETI